MHDSIHSRDRQLAALLKTASAATPLQSDLGQCFIRIPPNRIVPLRSTDFQNWLLEQFHSEHRFVPRPSLVREIVQLLEAKTQFGNTTRTPISRRVASASGKVILDLCNEGDVVEISATGWHIANNLTTHFRSSLATTRARSQNPKCHTTRSKNSALSSTSRQNISPAACRGSLPPSRRRPLPHPRSPGRRQIFRSKPAPLPRRSRPHGLLPTSQVFTRSAIPRHSQLDPGPG